MLLRSMEVTAGETAELEVLVIRAKNFRWEGGVQPRGRKKYSNSQLFKLCLYSILIKIKCELN